MTSTPIRGVLLDAVGTLIDPLPSVSDAYRAAAARQGVELPREEIRRRFYAAFTTDESDEQRGPLSTSEEVERRRWCRIVHQVMPEIPDPDRAFVELWEHFERPASWRTFPDVAPALSRLRESGIRYRIASNFDGRLRSVISGLPELADHRDELVISSEVGYRKPHANFYLAGCELLELAPSDVLCVGDDPENDVRGPRSAGFRALLVDRKNGGGRYTDLLALVNDLVAGGLDSDGTGDR